MWEMKCIHRFSNQLIPKQTGIKYFFIGTFNPSWDATNNNNAEYFYGRGTNLFWCILPHAFNENCLINGSVDDWKSFCNLENHKIGLTDLIKCVNNVDENNPIHKKALTSAFSDKELVKKVNGFELEYNVIGIKEIIYSNIDTLKGVFFTRVTKTGIEPIWDKWSEIKEYCKEINEKTKKNIYTTQLLSPSSRGKVSIRNKILNWKTEIEKCK